MRTFFQAFLAASVVVAVDAMALATVPAAQDDANAPQADLDPKAEEVLRAMSDYLSGLTDFAFEAEETFDEVDASGQKTMLSHIVGVAVRRPDKISSNIRGDSLSGSLWYDGRTIALLDEQHNAYATVAAPPTVETALDHLANEYQIILPLGDLLYPSVYEVFTENAVKGSYLGLHHVGSLLAHHLAFRSEFVDWQLWVDAGDTPVPRKLVITYKNEQTHPQFTAVIYKWNDAPEVTDDLFTFETPAGAVEMELTSFSQALPAWAGPAQDAPSEP